jgi:hypothetical protein
MMLRAPETEALDDGYAQKGFGVSSLDGSPVPLGSTATGEPIEIPRSLWGRWKSPDATGSKPRGSGSTATLNKLISAIINNHRRTSGCFYGLVYEEEVHKLLMERARKYIELVEKY